MADNEEVNEGDLEVAAEQATAIGTWQAARMLKNLCDAVDEVASQPPGRK
jgi:hypothetical protein